MYNIMSDYKTTTHVTEQLNQEIEHYYHFRSPCMPLPEYSPLPSSRRYHYPDFCVHYFLIRLYLFTL